MNRALSTFEPMIRGAVLLTLVLPLSCAEPESAGLAFHRGLNAVEDERFDLARSYFEQELQERPDHLEALRQLCLAWRRGANQALVPSLAVMEKYLRLVPDDQEILRLFIDTHLMLGQTEAAAERLDSLDDSAPAWTLRARALLDVDLAAAEQAITRALALDSTAPAMRLVAADIARKAGDRERELRQLKDAVELDPLEPRARYRLGRAMLLQGDRAVGTEEIELSGRLTELRAAASPDNGNAVAALRVIDSLGNTIDTSQPRVSTVKARLLLEAGRVEEGLELLAALESNHSLSVPEQVSHAGLLARSGRSAEALGRYRQLLATDPSLRVVRLAAARILRARGEGAEAETLLREGLNRESFVAHFHAELAGMALADDRTTEATEALQTALEFAPWAAPWRVELARIEVAQGRRDEADRILAAAPEPSRLIERFRLQQGLEPSAGRNEP